ncbi:MAG: polysaccharide biosynthesis tyrosine autokinase [Motiliproteus sp.]
MDTQTQQPLANRLADSEVIDLREYWRTVMRHKWGILGLALVVTLMAAMVVFSLTPIYRATATLLIEGQQNKVVSIEELYGLDTSKSEYFLTQFEILKSRQLAEKVIAKLALDSHPEFDPEAKSKGFDWQQYLPNKELPDWRQWLPIELPADDAVVDPQIAHQLLVNNFLARLSISPIRKTQLVNISFEASDATLAAAVANAVGETYIESNLEARMQLTYKASSWLMEQLEGLRAKLKEAEQRLQQFRETEQLVDEEGRLSLASSELDLISTKLVDARRQRLEAEGIFKQISRSGASQNYDVIPAVLAHPLVGTFKENLAEAERKKNELAQRYGPKHPKMIAAVSEVKRAGSTLVRQVGAVVGGVRNDFSMLVANERSLKRELVRAKSNVQSLNSKGYRLRELRQEVEVNRQLYDTFFTRHSETSATNDLATANARISDPAVKPLKPSKPNKKLVVAAAFAASLMLGIMLAFLLEALNTTLKHAGDVEQKLGVPMLGLLPLLKRGDKNQMALKAFKEERDRGFSESIRTIRTGVVLSGLDSPHKVLLITSSQPGEGKSTVAMNLACALGQMERVLLIDADMRRPSLAKVCGLAKNTAGLSELVAGSSCIKESVHTLIEDQVDVLPAGVIPPNPLELLGSKRFASVMHVLESHYDRIVIDAAPSLAVSDAMVLARHANSLIYVVRADTTPYQTVQSGLKRLQQANAPITGVVLNAVDVRKAHKYHGEGYAGYYDVYGYQES